MFYMGVRMDPLNVYKEGDKTVRFTFEERISTFLGVLNIFIPRIISFQQVQKEPGKAGGKVTKFKPQATP